MKAYVFSIGEKTTDLCVELMKEYGFEVVVYQDQTTLWEKLKRFYTEALESGDEDVMRIDADIIPNINSLKLTAYCSDSMGGSGTSTPKTWVCASGFDWYKQDRGAISIHVMHRDIIKKCLEHVEEAKDEVRPETYLWRLEDVNPHTLVVEDRSCGIHGYGQGDHRDRIKDLKHMRNQKYDWKLLEKIEAL